MIKLYISEYAKNKQAMEDNIGNKVDIIIEHLIKIILMPTNTARKHWEGEIAGQLNRVHKIKGKNKYPNYNQLIEWTYEYAKDDIEDIYWLKNEIDNIELEYNTDVQYSPNSLSLALDSVANQYFTWLCEKLAEYGSVGNAEIYDKLFHLV